MILIIKDYPHHKRSTTAIQAFPCSFLSATAIQLANTCVLLYSVLCRLFSCVWCVLPNNWQWKLISHPPFLFSTASQTEVHFVIIFRYSLEQVWTFCPTIIKVISMVKHIILVIIIINIILMMMMMAGLSLAGEPDISRVWPELIPKWAHNSLWSSSSKFSKIIIITILCHHHHHHFQHHHHNYHWDFKIFHFWRPLLMKHKLPLSKGFLYIGQTQSIFETIKWPEPQQIVSPVLHFDVHWCHQDCQPCQAAQPDDPRHGSDQIQWEIGHWLALTRTSPE